MLLTKIGFSLGEYPTSYLCSCYEPSTQNVDDKLWRLVDESKYPYPFKHKINPTFPMMCRDCSNCWRYFDAYYELLNTSKCCSFSAPFDGYYDDRQLQVLVQLKSFRPSIKVERRDPKTSLISQIRMALQDRRFAMKTQIMKSIKKNKVPKVAKSKLKVSR